jgi:hypothetical protein
MFALIRLLQAKLKLLLKADLVNLPGVFSFVTGFSKSAGCLSSPDLVNLPGVFPNRIWYDIYIEIIHGG